jgi:hypothetical protein
MGIWRVFAVIGFLIVGLIAGFFLRGVSMTGNVVNLLDEYSYTRAICSENECIDAVVFCEGGNVVKIEPIFYMVEHEKGWEDPRKEEFSGFCD